MESTVGRVEKLVKEKKWKRNVFKVKKEDEKAFNANIYAQKVEKKAYELYVKRGCQDGHDWDDWLEAERIVEEEMISGK